VNAVAATSASEMADYLSRTFRFSSVTPIEQPTTALRFVRTLQAGINDRVNLWHNANGDFVRVSTRGVVTWFSVVEQTDEQRVDEWMRRHRGGVWCNFCGGAHAPSTCPRRPGGQ